MVPYWSGVSTGTAPMGCVYVSLCMCGEVCIKELTNNLKIILTGESHLRLKTKLLFCPGRISNQGSLTVFASLLGWGDNCQSLNPQGWSHSSHNLVLESRMFCEELLLPIPGWKLGNTGSAISEGVGICTSTGEISSKARGMVKPQKVRCSSFGHILLIWTFPWRWWP